VQQKDNKKGENNPTKHVIEKVPDLTNMKRVERSMEFSGSFQAHFGPGFRNVTHPAETEEEIKRAFWTQRTKENKGQVCLASYLQLFLEASGDTSLPLKISLCPIRLANCPFQLRCQLHFLLMQSQCSSSRLKISCSYKAKRQAAWKVPAHTKPRLMRYGNFPLVQS
jgi:hypothetical protein